MARPRVDPRTQARQAPVMNQSSVTSWSSQMVRTGMLARARRTLSPSSPAFFTRSRWHWHLLLQVGQHFLCRYRLRISRASR